MRRKRIERGLGRRGGGIRALGVGLVLAAACSDGPPAPEMGRPVPDFTLPDLQGRKLRLSEMRGKVVLINFWASWCPPCVEEMPSLQKLHRALHQKGLEIVAVSVDEKVEDIEKFRKELGLSFTILHDKGARVSRTYQTFKYPESYLVDREGNLRWKVIGAHDWIAPDLMLELVELIKAGGTS